MKKLNQKGFGATGILIALIIMGLVGSGGWYVWSRNNKPASNSAPVTNNNSSPSEADSFELPNDWKTVTKNGLTISYPQSWDSVEVESDRLYINGAIEGNVVTGGFGAPIGYRYLGGSSWEYIDTISNKKIDDTQPKTAPANVNGADSTIIIGGADGGLSGLKIVFAYEGKLYSISLPRQHEDEAEHGSATIPREEIEDNLEQVIKSIVVN